jgi:tetratricopeptide (TPR) repeat protein
MKHLFILLTIVTITNLNAQTLDLKKLAVYEATLDDVMEIIGKELVKEKLKEVEDNYRNKSNELNTVRLGLIYHDVALNLTFFDKTKKYNGYAQKSYNILTKLSENKQTTPELMVYIESYRASSLSLVSGETRKLALLSDAFEIFENAVKKYASVSPRPEFMRGSVAENLPFFMWKKRKYAKIDFESIINKQKKDASYADFRIMSFSYWAWARANNGKKYRQQAIEYLNMAIEIDPNYKAGRERAEELKEKYSGK